MERDPSKRIVAFRGLMEGDAVRLVLVLKDGTGLIVNNDDLNEEQVNCLADGFADGLLGSVGLTKEMIDTFLNDPIGVASFELPPELRPDDQALFTRGALNGLALAADGYWMEPDDYMPRTIH